MERRTTFLLVSLLLTNACVGPLLAGNGKLSGSILDAQSGFPVLGNVQIVATLYGSAADSTGRYVLLEIPAGTYDIRCSAVGYRAQILKGLVIAPDRSLKRDFSLEAEEVPLEEMVIQAERVVVQSSQTSARTDFDGGEFRMLPLNATMDLIALSPSTFKQFIGSVSPVFSRTTIEGIDVTDETALWYADAMNVTSFNTRVNAPPAKDLATAEHSSFLEPNLVAVEQSTLFTGTAGADYASSVGTLVYTLREGRGAWAGEAMVRVSQLGGLHHLGPDVYWDAPEYFALRDTLAMSAYASARQTAAFYTWFPNKYPYRSRPDVTASLGIGGTVTQGVGLYLTGAYTSSANRLPNQKTQRFNGSAKLTWNFSPSMRLSLVGLLEDRGRLFGWKNSSYSDLFRYFLEGVPLWDGVHVTGGVKWMHLLSQNTSYELQASVTHDNQRQGFCDDNNDGIISPGEEGDFLTWSDTAQVHRYQASSGGKEFQKFFVASGDLADGKTMLMTSLLSWKVARPFIYYDDFTSRVVTLKGDVNSQVNPHHLLAAGVALRMHTIERESRSGYGETFSGPKSYFEDCWSHHPRDLALYVQDRMEYSGLVMNLGVRLEGTLLDVAPVVNWFVAPDIVVDAQGGVFAKQRRGSRLPWNWFLSPRVAFSHPIGHTAAVHFSFSHTRITPPYAFIFAKYDLAFSGVWGTAINVEQDPVTASNYDIGIQWAIASRTLLTVNAYTRDYANMDPVMASVYLHGGSTPYFVFSNALPADSRGIELSIQRDLTPVAHGIKVGGRVAYAYTHLSSGFETGNNKSAFSSVTGDSAALDGRLPFGDFSTWNRSFIEAVGGGSTRTRGFNRNHRITCAFIVTFPGDVRLSGKGMFTSGFWYEAKLKSDLVVSYARAPWNRRIDIRLEKQFSFSERLRLDLFVDILNAFNWVNVLAYFDYLRGDPAAWEIHGDPTGGKGINRPVTFDGSLIYDIPREVYFGVRFGF